MLVAVRWWPPDIPFDVDDLLTVGKVLEERNKRRT
jgi:hypothetical protein